jgi:drug/metabolite transporter (DMT)-like permease
MDKSCQFFSLVEEERVLQTMTTHHKNYFILAALVIFWALSWPLLKIALEDMPPLWLSVARLLLGSLAMFIFVVTQKQFIVPSRQDLPLIFSIGFLQMAAFVSLMNYGLLFVEPGRSAILAYSTPIWVIPLAICFFREKIIPLNIAGFLLGIGGILVLFNPSTLNWSDYPLLKGNFALILAAICWAIAMLHTRYGQWHNSTTTLLPWQLLLGGLCVLPLAIIFEPVSSIHWTHRLVWIIIYTVLLSTAFGYWGVITISKNLSVTLTSLSLLLVPVLGLLFSALIVGEPITTGILIAMVLIVSGLACAALTSRFRTPSQDSN